MILPPFEAFRAAVRGIEPPAYKDAASPAGSPAVLTILDDFSYACFAPEMNAVPVSRMDYRSAFDYYRPEFVLIESAWQGNKGNWRHQLVSPAGPKEAFIDLLAEARRRDVPIAFWNKEDPPHFEQFLPVAKLADYVFTTAGELLDQYAEAVGHQNVAALPFAAQPSIHHPFSDQDRDENICFAGQYFTHKFPERRAQMDFLFPAAARHGLTIYSRELGKDPRYAFPEPYAGMVKGSLPYNEIVRAYRRFKVFLNVNSVVDSPTMCARRIFELSASGAVILSARSRAIPNFYHDDELPLADSEQDAALILDHLFEHPEELRAIAHRAWRRTLREHTYRHRVLNLRAAMGFSSTESTRKLDVVIDARGARSVEPAQIEFSVRGWRSVLPAHNSVYLMTDDQPESGPEAVETVTPSGLVSLSAERDLIVATPTARMTQAGLNDAALAIDHYRSRGILGKSAYGDPLGASWRERTSARRSLWLAPQCVDLTGVLAQDMFSGGVQISHIDNYNLGDSALNADLSTTAEV